MMMSSTEVAARITFAYRTVLSRPPAEEEMAVVMELYQQQMRKYEAMPEEAKKAVTFGKTPVAAELSERELAAWTLVANLILNLDEAVVRN